jgi:hypothetical protein
MNDVGVKYLTKRLSTPCAADSVIEHSIDRVGVGQPECEGERRMLREMLLDAIECWQRAGLAKVAGGNSFNSRERLHQEADRWIFGKYDNSPCFSFTKTCDCLGLDPDFIRRRLLEWCRIVALREQSSPAPTAELGRFCKFAIESDRQSSLSNKAQRQIQSAAKERVKKNPPQRPVN